MVILAPSHYCPFRGFAIPFMGCQYYSTPFGKIPLDVEEIESLRHSLNAISLTQSQDEEEHSIEMMLPFLHALYVHFLKERRLKLPKLIPLLIGSFTNCSGLLNLFKDPSCIFVISSDFCHWGSRYKRILKGSTLHHISITHLTSL